MARTEEEKDQQTATPKIGSSFRMPQRSENISNLGEFFIFSNFAIRKIS
jgi:hypothetical protein